MTTYLVIVMWSGVLVTFAGLYLAIGCLLLCLFDVRLGISESFDVKNVPIMMVVMALWPLVLGCHLLHSKESDSSGESPDSGRV